MGGARTRRAVHGRHRGGGVVHGLGRHGGRLSRRARVRGGRPRRLRGSTGDRADRLRPAADAGRPLPVARVRRGRGHERGRVPQHDRRLGRRGRPHARRLRARGRHGRGTAGGRVAGGRLVPSGPGAGDAGLRRGLRPPGLRVGDDGLPRPPRPRLLPHRRHRGRDGRGRRRHRRRRRGRALAARPRRRVRHRPRRHRRRWGPGRGRGRIRPGPRGRGADRGGRARRRGGLRPARRRRTAVPGIPRDAEHGGAGAPVRVGVHPGAVEGHDVRHHRVADVVRRPRPRPPAGDRGGGERVPRRRGARAAGYVEPSGRDWGGSGGSRGAERPAPSTRSGRCPARR